MHSSLFLTIGGQHDQEYPSQSELAKTAGINIKSLSPYEIGASIPPANALKAIADALEVSVGYLIGKTNLILDKETLHRIEDISSLKEENKNFIFNLIDMALRDIKARRAYS